MMRRLKRDITLPTHLKLPKEIEAIVEALDRCANDGSDCDHCRVFSKCIAWWDGRMSDVKTLTPSGYDRARRAQKALCRAKRN